MVAWYGEQEETGEGALPWIPELMELRRIVESETGLEFNAVLMNLYRNGSDNIIYLSPPRICSRG